MGLSKIRKSVRQGKQPSPTELKKLRCPVHGSGTRGVDEVCVECAQAHVEFLSNPKNKGRRFMGFMQR